MARRPAQNRRPPPKGATTKSRQRSTGGGGSFAGIPGWLWAVAGIIGGFALSQYLDRSSPEPVAAVVPKPTASQPAASSSSSSASGGSGATGAEAGNSAAQPATPTFEFYTLLPETEVIAPNSGAANPEPSARTSQEAAADDAANQTPQPAATGRYMLQAASFRDLGDAERLANRLKDFGLLAKITDVRANGDQLWHRVQVGPYQDTRELNRAQDLMVTQGIEPLMIRLQN